MSMVKSQAKWRSLGRMTIGHSTHSIEKIPMWHISRTKQVSEKPHPRLVEEIEGLQAAESKESLMLIHASG